MIKKDLPNSHLYFNFCVFVFCFSLLSLYAIAPEESWDVFWHLKMGQDWLEKGLSPYIDHYSFTNYGDSISAVPVFFQVCVAYLVLIFGEQSGFYFFKLAYIFLLFIVLAVYLKQIRAPWIVVFLVLPFFSYFVAHRIMLRPELISNILMLICMVLYVRARQSFTHKELFAITLLLLVWVNYHSPVLGYIIVFGLFLDRFVYKAWLGERSYSWKLFYLWAVIIFFVGFLNREGQHFIFSMLDFVLNNKGNMTLEYLPARDFYAANKMVHVSWALSICVAVWALAKKHYGFSFISILLLYFSWSTARLVAPVAMVSILILAYLLSNYYIKKEYLRLKPAIRQLLVVSISALALFSYYELTAIAIKEYKYQDYRSARLVARYPVQVTSYLKKYQIGGKILNPMSTGGYLLNALAPDFKVYLDGRTNILYPLSRLNHYSEMLNQPKIMREEIKRYDVDYVLLANRPWLLSLVSGMKGITLNYADDRFMLFSKDNAKNAFPVASLMSVAPACWKESLTAGVKKEYQLAQKIFNDEPYLIRSALNILNAYSLSSDKKEFLINQFKIDVLPDRIKRLLGYLAMKNKMYSISLKYFADINGSNSTDQLLAAYLMAMTGNNSDAEKALLSFTNSHIFYFMPNVNTADISRKITPYQTSLLLFILDKISQNYKLRYFAGADFNALKEKHAESDAKYVKGSELTDPSIAICQALKSGLNEVIQ